MSSNKFIATHKCVETQFSTNYFNNPQAYLSRAEVEIMLGITLQQTRVYREIKEEGRQEGRQEGEQEATVKLIVRQLTKRLGQELSKEMQATISHLPLTVLENLSVALLDFSSLADLQAWLDAQ